MRHRGSHFSLRGVGLQSRLAPSVTGSRGNGAALSQGGTSGRDVWLSGRTGGVSSCRLFISLRPISFLRGSLQVGVVGRGESGISRGGIQPTSTSWSHI